jgi:hypothetical protein
MINIEITDYIQQGTIFINDICLFHKEFINGLTFLWAIPSYIIWPIFYYHHQLVQIVNSQLITPKACQHSNYAEKKFNFNLGPKNP